MAEAMEETKHVKHSTSTNEDSVKDNDRDADSGSGSENGEKPVREKLQKTDLQEDSKMIESTSTANGTVEKHELPKLKKKRSFKDSLHEDDGPSTPSEGIHARKKTREASGLKFSETAATEQEENKQSDEDSDKAVVTPPSSQDEAMLEATGTAKIQKKRSSDEMLDSQDVLKSPKVAATRKERERRSSSATPSSEGDNATPSKNSESSKSEPPRSVPSTTPSKTEKSSATIPATSGFANTSSVSPLAGLATQKSPMEALPQTSASASAFAGSGFAALASSGSPFASLAKAKSPPLEDKQQTSSSAFASSGFASMTSTASPFTAASAITKPISTLGTSPFASSGQSSGFGSGSAFGSSFGSGFGSASGKISTFAAPVGDVKPPSAAAAKPFGASDDSDHETEGGDGDEEGGEENESDAGFGDASNENGTRFKIQTGQNTGEEGEATAFALPQARLWQQNDKTWIERGKGPFKLNYKVTNGDEIMEPHIVQMLGWDNLTPGKCTVDARMLMRNSATHKVIINVRIFKEMSIGDASKSAFGDPGENPGALAFVAFAEDGKPHKYLLRAGKKENLKELYDQVKKVQEYL